METTGLNHTVQDEQFDNEVKTTTQESETLVESYSTLTKEELIERLREMVEAENVSTLKDDVEAIKIAFYKQRKMEIEIHRKQFTDEGGNAEEFTPELDGAEVKLKELLATYREKRNEATKELEVVHNNNYQMKLEIIEKLKELINSEEAIGETFTSFRELQGRWREIGNVPKGNVNDMWETYHHYTEQFYDYLKINNELRDIDLKKNFEAKVALCEKAESLIIEPAVINAFRELQQLHDEWREIGPVQQSQKDELWNRFKAASTIINKRHQEYFESLKEEQLANLRMKSELCEKVEAILAQSIVNHSDWEKATNEIIDIQKLWKGIGFAPKKDNNTIYERFRTLCNKFFDAKQEFYSKQKESSGTTIEAKIALCEKAEALQESTDWQATTNELIRLQGEWKQLGFSSRKEGEALWKRFRAACDKFFDARTAHQSTVNEEYVVNLERKRAIIEELKNFSIEQPDEAIAKLKEIQRSWSEIGFIPIKEKNKIQNEYRDLINGLFASFKGQVSDIQLDRYKDKVSKIKDGARHGVSQEREKLLYKLKKIEGDITLLENNIGFFSHSKGAESLIKDVELKIEKAREEARVVREKIKILNEQ